MAHSTFVNGYLKFYFSVSFFGVQNEFVNIYVFIYMYMLTKSYGHWSLSISDNSNGCVDTHIYMYIYIYICAYVFIVICVCWTKLASGINVFWTFAISGTPHITKVPWRFTLPECNHYHNIRRNSSWFYGRRKWSIKGNIKQCTVFTHYSSNLSKIIYKKQSSIYLYTLTLKPVLLSHQKSMIIIHL